jgi:hypothetical protein
MNGMRICAVHRALEFQPVVRAQLPSLAKTEPKPPPVFSERLSIAESQSLYGGSGLAHAVPLFGLSFNSLRRTMRSVVTTMDSSLERGDQPDIRLALSFEESLTADEREHLASFLAEPARLAFSNLEGR